MDHILSNLLALMQLCQQGMCCILQEGGSQEGLLKVQKWLFLYLAGGGDVAGPSAPEGRTGLSLTWLSLGESWLHLTNPLTFLFHKPGTAS